MTWIILVIISYTQQEIFQKIEFFIRLILLERKREGRLNLLYNFSQFIHHIETHFLVFARKNTLQTTRRNFRKIFATFLN